MRVRNLLHAEEVLFKGFRDFLLKNNVLALAVAVIIGGAVGKVVSSLATDVIMPLVSPLLPQGDWRAAHFEIGRRIGPDGKPVINNLNYGTFFGNVVDFLIISMVVYGLTKAILREKKVAPPPSKTCPRCKEPVAVEATKCKFCTADI